MIAVDWGKLCPKPFYIEARSHVKGVGQQVAGLVDFLVAEQLLKTEDLHVLGHSLGAHVAGNVGKSVTSGDVQRITGENHPPPMSTRYRPDNCSIRCHTAYLHATLVFDIRLST